MAQSRQPPPSPTLPVPDHLRHQSAIRFCHCAPERCDLGVFCARRKHQAQNILPGSLTSQFSSPAKANTSGTRLRPHCSQAENSYAAPVLKPARGTLTFQAHHTAPGGHRNDTRDPSSTAFCTVRSIFSPDCKACTRVRLIGDSHSTSRHSSTSTATRSFSSVAMRATYSPNVCTR